MACRLWCGPSVREAQQSNVSRKSDVNTVFVAEMFTVASEPAVISVQLHLLYTFPEVVVFRLTQRETKSRLHKLI